MSSSAAGASESLCNPTVENSASILIKRISISIRDNMVGIAVFLVLLMVIGYILWNVGKDMWATYSQWKTISDASKEVRGAQNTSSSHTFALLDPPDHPEDDVVEPDPVTEDGVSADLPGEPPIAALKRRYQKIAAKYSAYNDAISKHVNSAGLVPDDVIDQSTLLSRKPTNEVYEYKRIRSSVDQNADGTNSDARQ